jgi:hypothetical protein
VKQLNDENRWLPDLIETIRSYRNKVQISRSVRMPQLHTLLHFHLAPIVMINGSSCRDLILDSQYFCRSILCKNRESVIILAVFATTISEK